MSRFKVLLLPPNVVGHARVLLLLAALALGQRSSPLAPTLSLLFSLSLDFLDGYLARRFKQATAFGAFYDVAIDISSRAILWTWGSHHPLMALPVILECLTFVCLHKEGGAAWKTGCFSPAPPLIRAVMRNGFRNPLGVWAVGGLFGCPLWLWSRRFCRGGGGFPGGASRCGSSGGGLGDVLGGTLRLLLAALPSSTLSVLPLPLASPLGQLLGSFLEGTGGGGGAGVGRELLPGVKGWSAAGGRGSLAGDVLLCVLGWGAWGLLLVPGRVLAAVVEVWVVWKHVGGLLDQGATELRSTSWRTKVK